MSKEIEPTIVKLRYPLEWVGDNGKELITEVELRRPKGKDIKNHIDKDMNLDNILKVAAKISKYTPRFFDELDAVDCLQVSEAVSDFLDDGPETGRTS